MCSIVYVESVNENYYYKIFETLRTKSCLCNEHQIQRRKWFESLKWARFRRPCETVQITFLFWLKWIFHSLYLLVNNYYFEISPFIYEFFIESPLFPYISKNVFHYKLFDVFMVKNDDEWRGSPLLLVTKMNILLINIIFVWHWLDWFRRVRLDICVEYVISIELLNRWS